MSRTKIFKDVQSPGTKCYSSGSLIESDEIIFLEEIPTQRNRAIIPCYTIKDESPMETDTEVITLDDDDDIKLESCTPATVVNSCPLTPPETPISPVFSSQPSLPAINCVAGFQTAPLYQFKLLPKPLPISLLPTPTSIQSPMESPKMSQLTPIGQSHSIFPVPFLSPSVSSDTKMCQLSACSSLDSSLAVMASLLEFGASQESPKKDLQPRSTPFSDQFYPKIPRTVTLEKSKLKSILKLPLGETLEESLAWVKRVKKIMAEKNMKFNEAARLEREERKNKIKNRKVRFNL